MSDSLLSNTLRQINKWQHTDGTHQVICNGDMEFHIIHKDGKSIIKSSSACQCSPGAKEHHQKVHISTLPDHIQELVQAPA